jgi:peptidyl-prolyl cis-trans isomerase SurA
LAVAAGAAALCVLISRAEAQVVTTVDDQPITDLDVQQRTRFREMGTHKTPTRQEIIDELRNEIKEISLARSHGIAPSESDVNKMFQAVARRMGIDDRKLTDILTNAGTDAATLKQRLRARMAETNLEHAGFDSHAGRY